MARILVTGASGFTGRYLVERLVRDDHEVHGLERDSYALAIPGIAMHLADLLDSDAVRNVVEAARPDYVIHLAAVAFVAHHDPLNMYATNVVGTRNLLESLSELSRPPTAVVIASSANVYGNQRGGQLRETTIPVPANDYGVSKLAVEHLARIFSARLPITVTRPFNYTGVGQSERFLIPKLVGHARRGQRQIRLGNLDVARDFSDVRAIAEAYVKLIGAPEAIGKTINLCSGVARPLREVLRLVEQASGHEFEVTIDPALVRDDEVTSLCGSRELSDATIGVLDWPALEQTINWMMETVCA